MKGCVSKECPSSRHRKYTGLFYPLIMFCLLLTTPLGVTADMYKWVDERGNIHFTDKPPLHANTEAVNFRINVYSAPDSEISIAKDRGKSAKKVIMYSAKWCGVCKRARDYFKANEIPFSEYDIETSRKGRSDYKRLSGRGVPIILVGSHRMNGFSASRFKKLWE